jgi:hypothetical protein
VVLNKLALAGAFGIGFVTPAVGQQQCDGTWSTPFALRTADGRPVYVERGVIASDGDRTLLIGKPTFVWLSKDSLFLTRGGDAEADARSVYQHAGVLVDATVVATPVPPFGDVRLLDNPRLLGATKGRKTIAWEVADSAPRKGPRAEIVAIEAATLTDGRWVDSQTLITRGKLVIGTPPAVRSSRDVDHQLIAAAVHDSTKAVRIAWKTSDGGWKTAEWRGATYVTYATASRTSGGDFVVLVIGSISTFVPAGVFAIRAIPNADTIAWLPPVRLDTLSGWYEALSWARLGEDSLVAVWPLSSNGLMEMITTVTVDGGRHWTLTSPLVSSLKMDAQMLAVDSAGVVHLVYRAAPHENILNEPGLIMHSLWRSGQWSTPRAVSQHPSDTGPMIGSAAGGRLMAVWTEASGKLPVLLPKSVASLWTPGCAAR